MPSLFRPALPLLQQYADYHRDPRNILTHIVGVPMIVFGICVLLARLPLTIGPWQSSLAWVVAALAGAWYLTRGHLGVGLATTLLIALLAALAHLLSQGPTLHWLGWGLGMFVVGWIIQFVGHYYEGRKPAFVDDIVGLLVGPMFVVMEFGALLGLFKGLVRDVESHAGPTRLRDLAHPAAGR